MASKKKKVTRGKTVELSADEVKELKLLSAKIGVPMKTLSSEALDLLLKKYKVR